MAFQSLTGMQYLQCEIACKADKAFEKATWDERLAHFDSLDFTNPNTFKSASNPVGLRAAVLAYMDTLDGLPTGYMVSLDACSSGMQILSLLVECPTSFSLCGGDSDQCVDSYVEIYDSMNLHGVLTRKQVKAAIMTSLYGSVAMPELTFGANVDQFYDTMEKMAPGAWDLNQGLQELWDDVPGATYSWVLPDNFHACIETKDKEKLEFSLMGKPYALVHKVEGRPKFHKGLGPNLIHSIDGMVVREMLRRCMFDKGRITEVINAITTAVQGANEITSHDKMVERLWAHYEDTGFLSARILDHITVENVGITDQMVIAELIQSMPDEPFDIVTVHDCFRAHPNHGDDLRRQYNRIMADVAQSTILKSMASQVAQKKINAKKVGKIDRDSILNANYMLA